MTHKAIGIFDSGIGGTSIWKEITALLPHENTIYLADSKNAPYGRKSKDEIIALSIKNIDHLITMQCKLIVIACNTATTNAIKVIREKYDIPIVAIEPAIKPAAIRSKTKKIGILATKGTLSSELFSTTSQRYAANNGIEIIEVIGTGLVELIEAGKINSDEMYQLLESYVRPMISEKIDHLVLGCTHYPYLIPVLNKMLFKEVMIIDSGAAVAKQTERLLKENKLINLQKHHSTHQLYTNHSIAVLQDLLPTSPHIQVTLLDF